MSNTEVYREALTPLLVKRGVGDRLSDEDRDELVDAWGKMVPWPDAVAGIGELRRKYAVCTLTNASMAQMTALVKDNRLPFDEILTGELRHAFKPDPKVYQLAVDYVGYRPNQLLMVSAHKWDLQAAKQAGFHTAYVPRPFELGPGHSGLTTSEARGGHLVHAVASPTVEVFITVSKTQLGKSPDPKSGMTLFQ